MSESHPVERYYSAMTARPPILMLCLMFGGLAVMLLFSIVTRGSYTTDDLVMLALSCGVLGIIVAVVRNMYTPAIILTDSEMLVRRLWKHKRYRLDSIEAMATYSKMYHPKRVAGMSPSAGQLRPVFIDHLLLKTLTGVHHLELPRYSNEKLLASLEARSGVEIRELDHSSQARKWAKGRLDENSD